MIINSNGGGSSKKNISNNLYEVIAPQIKPETKGEKA